MPIISCWYHIDFWLVHWSENECKGVIALILDRTYVNKYFNYRILIQAVANITTILKLNENVYFHLVVICPLKGDCPQERNSDSEYQRKGKTSVPQYQWSELWSVLMLSYQLV